MLRLDDLDSLHALIEQGRVRFCPTRLEKYAYIGKDYPAPVQPRPRDPIRDVLFPKREPGWLLDKLIEDWLLAALRGDGLAEELFTHAGGDRLFSAKESA